MNDILDQIHTDAEYALRQLRMALGTLRGIRETDCCNRAVDALDRILERSDTSGDPLMTEIMAGLGSEPAVNAEAKHRN